MCGRFCCALNPELVKLRLAKENVIKDADSTEWVDQELYKSSFNVCPTRHVPVLLEKNQKKFLQSMYWGFIPSWSKALPTGKPINARVETLLENNGGIFDKSKNTARCIIAAEGFYEWNRKRQPHYVKRKDGQLMLFAGLYSVSNIDGQTMTTCVIITTAASNFFSKVHDRMPVILEPSEIDKWLDNKQTWNQQTIDLLQQYKGGLQCYRVSDQVGPTKNDSPDLTVPLDQNKNSISQFLKPVDKHVEMNKFILPASNLQKRKRETNDTASKKTPKITNFFVKK